MQKLREEQPSKQASPYGDWIRPFWKKTAAGLAAALVIAVGTLSMNGGTLVQIADNIPGLNQPDNSIPSTTEPVNNNATAPSGTEDPASKPLTTNHVIAQNPIVNGIPSGIFLNKQRYVVTTFLRLEVDDSPQALEKALQIAADFRAPSLNLGQQIGENGAYTAVKITVPGTRAADLIAQLSALGTVSSQEQNKNDITTRYADTLSQYQTSVTQKAATQDNDQKVLLDQQIAELAAELQNWEQQAENETIVLWLE